jgi:trehalose/maltose hydrolase-like predicted phosphorylase
MAFRLHWHASHNITFLSESFKLINATAAFWASRFVQRTASSTNENSISNGSVRGGGGAGGGGGGAGGDFAMKGKGKGIREAGRGNWTVLGVVGPDEPAGQQNSEVYTNAIAAQTIFFAAEAAKLLGLPPVPSDWLIMATSPYIPLSSSLDHSNGK